MSDTFKALLTDLGRRLGLDGLSPDDDGECVLEIGGLEVALMEQGGSQVLIHGGVGALASGAARDRQMARLLGGNYFFWETGGGALAADPVTGDIRLFYRQSMDGLDGLALSGLLGRFLERLEYWQAACQADGDDDAPSGGHAVPGADMLQRV